MTNHVRPGDKPGEVGGSCSSLPVAGPITVSGAVPLTVLVLRGQVEAQEETAWAPGGSACRRSGPTRRDVFPGLTGAETRRDGPAGDRCGRAAARGARVPHRGSAGARGVRLSVRSRRPSRQRSSPRLRRQGWSAAVVGARLSISEVVQTGAGRLHSRVGYFYRRSATADAALPPSSAPVGNSAPARPAGPDGRRHDAFIVTTHARAVLSPSPPGKPRRTLREILGLLAAPTSPTRTTKSSPGIPGCTTTAGQVPVPPSERDRFGIPAPVESVLRARPGIERRGRGARRRSDPPVELRRHLPRPRHRQFSQTAHSTLPKGRVYIENSPGTFFGKSRSFPAQYNWEFLIRYGLTDDLEFRLFSPGLSATMGRPHTTGFSPLTFDFKYHMWDENLEKHIPAAGAEIYIQTPFGSIISTAGHSRRSPSCWTTPCPSTSSSSIISGSPESRTPSANPSTSSPTSGRCSGRCSRTSPSSRTDS